MGGQNVLKPLSCKLSLNEGKPFLWLSLWRLVKVCVIACCPLQVKTEISVESKHQTLQGLAFPLQETARRALQQLAQKRINYIQLVNLRA